VTESSKDQRSVVQDPKACPYCGGTKIAKALKLNQSAEVGRIGLPYRAAGIFTATEALHADLCENCGTVLRFFVLEPERKWISS